MTFSIVARDLSSGMFGAAISSSSPAVAARCVHARAGVGIVATQNITDPRLGPMALQRLAAGESAQVALQSTLSATPHAAYRQLAVLGAVGPPAVHTGSAALGTVGSACAADAAAAGNMLACAEVPQIMLAAFKHHSGHLGERLLAALIAALDAGGEAGPVHSAGLLVVREVSWPIVDLRVDWSEDPIGDLSRVWSVYAPQIDDYVRRAIDPCAAPSYGVPGNL